MFLLHVIIYRYGYTVAITLKWVVSVVNGNLFASKLTSKFFWLLRQTCVHRETQSRYNLNVRTLWTFAMPRTNLPATLCVDGPLAENNEVHFNKFLVFWDSVHADAHVEDSDSHSIASQRVVGASPIRNSHLFSIQVPFRNDVIWFARVDQRVSYEDDIN